MTVPDSLNLPGRPTHIDVNVLSSIVLETDAKSEEGLELPDHLSNVFGPAETAQIIQTAIRQAADLMSQYKGLPDVRILSTAWIVGLGAGARTAHGTTIDHVGKDWDSIVPGIDKASAMWVADQRAMRIAAQTGANVPSCAAAWMDGLCAGFQFQAAKADLTH